MSQEFTQQPYEVEIVNSFGVGTARYCSCWPSPLARRTPQNSYGSNSQSEAAASCSVDLPLGSSIVRWDLERQERTKFFRPHTDVVTCMCTFRSNDRSFNFTASESGEVALWGEEWNMLDRSHHATRRVKITHAAISPCGTRLVTTSEYGSGLGTLFKVYRESFGDDVGTPLQGPLRITKLMEFGENAHYTFIEWAGAASNCQLVAVRQPPRTSARDPSQPSEKSLAQREGVVALHLLTIDEDSGNWHVSKERTLTTSSVSAVAICDGDASDRGTEKRIMALGLAGRRVDVIDMLTLDTLWTVDASGGSGLIKCLALKSGGRLVCPTDSGRIAVWDHERLHSDFLLPGVGSGSIYYLNCDDDLQEAWVVNEAGIHRCPLTSTLESKASSRSIVFHAMTCCGIDFNKEGDQLVVGDFAGSVVQWDIRSHRPLASTIVPCTSPVRSLCWRRRSDISDTAAVPYVLIGCVSGDIYSWSPGSKASPQLVASVGDTVTCMRWENRDNPRLLAVGTTRGRLVILKLQEKGHDEGSIFTTTLDFIAHTPVSGPQDLKFGSIGLFAEIWSLSWSPDNKAIATCSEDQTTCIWSTSEGIRLRTLTGHTTAVTSVDWQIMHISGSDHSDEVLATCADDQKVMVWNARTWELMQTFDTTSDIHEWHTLTYLALQANGTKLCCVTQNGSVALWDLSRKAKLWINKLHAGSIEGLAWSSTTDYIATCSSDCTVHLLQHRTQ